MWAYAEHNKFLDFSGKLGLQEGHAHREEHVRLQDPEHLQSTIGQHGSVDQEKKIKILGEAGQGVKLLSFTLASILARLGHEVSLKPGVRTRRCAAARSRPT